LDQIWRIFRTKDKIWPARLIRSTTSPLWTFKLSIVIILIHVSCSDISKEFTYNKNLPFVVPRLYKIYWIIPTLASHATRTLKDALIQNYDESKDPLGLDKILIKTKYKQALEQDEALRKDKVKVFALLWSKLSIESK
jgi:hypothetical protein